MAGPGQLVEAMHRLPIGGAAAHPVEFRAALAAATSDLNGATLGEVGLSRLDLFQMVERPCLLPIGPVARRRDSEGAQEEPV